MRNAIGDRLRQIAGRGDSLAPADEDLLARFVATRDADAFAVLVRRHGPRVLAVCRRVTGDVHVAEDAFQAVFLVLARKAAAVRQGASVGGFLYRVAYHTALRARTMAGRRAKRETPTADLRDHADRPPPTHPDADALQILDDEIARLPDHLRAVVIVCELDGTSRADAAGRLGIPAGTISSRLAKARKVLADRLRKRGVALGAGGVAALLGQAAPAGTVPSDLVEAATGAAIANTAPAWVLELSRLELRAMLFDKLKVISVGVVLAVAGAAGGALWSARAEEPAPRDGPAAKADAGPRAESPGRIYFSEGDVLYAVDADGKNERAYKFAPGSAAGSAVVSPDGHSIAYWARKEDTAVDLRVRDLGADADRSSVTLPGKIGFNQFCWSPDGTELYTSTGAPGQRGVRHSVADVNKKTLKNEAGFGDSIVTDWSRDGKVFLATVVGAGEFWQPKTIRLVNRNGSPEADVIKSDGFVQSGKFSPDMRRVLCLIDGKLSVFDVGKPILMPVAKVVEGIPATAEVTSWDWSPDGKRIVYVIGTVRILSPEEMKKTESRVVAADPDGKNAVVVRSVKGSLLMNVGWRVKPPAAKDDKEPSRKEQIEESAKKIKELQKERIATLKEMADQATHLYQSGRVSFEPVLEARLQLLKAELDAAEKESERITLHKKFVDAMKDYETWTEERVKSARGTAATVLKVKAMRLEAEIHLEQAKVKEAKEGK